MGHGLDKKAIQEEIRRLQELLRLADDPKFQENLKRFSKEAKGRMKTAPEPNAPGSSAPAALPPSQLLTPQALIPQHPRGYVLKAVENAALALSGTSFTTQAIEDKMREDGFVFNSKIPNITINEGLRTLAKRGVVEASGRKGVQILWTVRTVVPNRTEEKRTGSVM